MLGQKQRSSRGFTLVELAVVVVIIGVLAAFGVPRFLQSVERSKASEAFAYLSAVRSAQERYQSREGTYAGAITDLDIAVTEPRYFDVGTITKTENTWTLTLTRKPNSAGYLSGYTVIFDQTGYLPASTIPADINPLGSTVAAATTS